ncbi:MAG: Ig-like domain-containing protein, partial [Flavobacteriaceae bacterium]|nr:Ig-like domain-containing protein [Flavobacteriaceae bacterium]
MKKVVFFLALVFSGVVAFAQNVPVISNTNLPQTVEEAGTIQQINLAALVSGTGTSTVTYAISLNPTQGTATIDETSGLVTYVHSGAHVGTDSFNWTVTTSDGSASGSVAITVTLANDAPVITAAPITVDEGKRITQAITSSDEENNPVEFEIVLQPTDGTLIINSNNEIVYTHNGNDCESCLTDTFSIRVKEQSGSVTSPRTGNTATYTVNVTQVNDAPTAGALTINLIEGATATANIEASDSDTSANSLSYSVVTQPLYGTLTISSLGEISYVHDGSESTQDSFEYQISDGALSNKYTVPVLITPANDAPVGAADTYFVLGTNPITINANVGVLSNDTDAEN